MIEIHFQDFSFLFNYWFWFFRDLSNIQIVIKLCLSIKIFFDTYSICVLIYTKYSIIHLIVKQSKMSPFGICHFSKQLKLNNLIRSLFLYPYTFARLSATRSFLRDWMVCQKQHLTAGLRMLRRFIQSKLKMFNTFHNIISGTINFQFNCHWNNSPHTALSVVA